MMPIGRRIKDFVDHVIARRHDTGSDETHKEDKYSANIEKIDVAKHSQQNASQHENVFEPVVGACDCHVGAPIELRIRAPTGVHDSGSLGMSKNRSSVVS